MAGIKSDITNKQFASSGFTELEVPDESQEVSEAELQAMNAHLASRGFPPIGGQVQGRPVEARKPASDESLEELESKMAVARKAKVTGRVRLTDSAKRRVEILCGLFKNTKEVDIDGNVFVLKVLKGKEIKQALVEASAFSGSVELPFETRKQFLARSLSQVAGTDIEMFLGDNSLEARLEFIEELDEPVLGALYGGYLTLVEESNKKYAIKTEDEAKEVTSDLKK